MFGHTADDIYGQHFRFIFPPHLVEKELPEIELEVAERDGKYEAEEWHQRKSGEKFWALNILTAIHNEAGETVSFTKIVKDLTERKRVEDTLYEQSEQLSRVKQDLNEFIYSASHELRAPACNIEGLLSIVDLNQPREDLGKIIKHMKSSLSVLQDKVDEVCRMANFTHRLEEQQPELINVEKAFQDIRYILRDKLADNPTTFTTRFEAQHFSFVKTQFHLVMHQLLLNAVEAADPAKDQHQIRISTRSSKAGILLEVSDNGRGIPEDQRQQVFDLFAKADSSEGHGLGLYYVRRIIEQTCGDIEVHSQVGKGSTFRVYLPTSEACVTPESSGHPAS